MHCKVHVLFWFVLKTYHVLPVCLHPSLPLYPGTLFLEEAPNFLHSKHPGVRNRGLSRLYTITLVKIFLNMFSIWRWKPNANIVLKFKIILSHSTKNLCFKINIFYSVPHHHHHHHHPPRQLQNLATAEQLQQQQQQWRWFIKLYSGALIPAANMLRIQDRAVP